MSRTTPWPSLEELGEPLSAGTAFGERVTGPGVKARQVVSEGATAGAEGAVACATVLFALS